MRVTRSYTSPPVNVTGWSTETATNGCVNPGWYYVTPRRHSRGGYTADLTPGWHKIRKRLELAGGLAPLNYYQRYDAHLQGDGHVSLTWQPFWCSQSGSWSQRTASVPAGPYPDGVNVLTHANVQYAIEKSGINSQAVLMKAAGKLWDGLDILTTLAELKSTLTLLPQTIKSAKRLWALQKVLATKGFWSLSQAKRVVSEWSGLYLQYRFGWEQLVRDCEDIHKHLKAKEHPVFKGVSGDSTSFTESVERVIGPYNNGESFTVREETVYDVSCRGVIYGVSALRHAKESAFINPLVAGWELIPFSWIVDYVVNIGDTIQAWSSLAALHQRVSAVSWRVSITRQTVIISVDKGGYLAAYTHTGQCTDHLEWKERIPTPVQPKPSLAITSSLTALANVLAVILQLITKR